MIIIIYCFCILFIVYSGFIVITSRLIPQMHIFRSSRIDPIGISGIFPNRFSACGYNWMQIIYGEQNEL